MEVSILQYQQFITVMIIMWETLITEVVVIDDVTCSLSHHGFICPNFLQLGLDCMMTVATERMDKSCTQYTSDNVY